MKVYSSNFHRCKVRVLISQPQADELLSHTSFATTYGVVA
jgi:hypothetical protein